MTTVEVRGMSAEDEYFVSTCTHVKESDEIDRCGRRRLAWFQDMRDKGLRVKVGLLDGEHAGFAYGMPIEVCPWGPLGEDLLAVPCLAVRDSAKGKGVGRALMAPCEEEAERQALKGVVVGAFYHDFWFMPASYFEKIGYSPARRRETEAILWKRFDRSAEAPAFLERHCQFVRVPGKVVVDLFWNTFCETSDIEAERVTEVAAEFGDSVVLNEYCADDRQVLLRHQVPRGIFVNGKEIGWGYEAPKEGIAEAISRALKEG